MRGREIIGAILESLNVPKADLARKLGITATNLYERMDNSKAMDLSATMLAGTVEPMQYKVVVMPQSIPTPENSYEVTPIVSESGRGKKANNKLDDLNLDELLK